MQAHDKTNGIKVTEKSFPETIPETFPNPDILILSNFFSVVNKESNEEKNFVAFQQTEHAVFVQFQQENSTEGLRSGLSGVSLSDGDAGSIPARTSS